MKNVFVLVCNDTVTVSSGDVFGDGNDARFKLSNVLQVPNYDDYAINQWLVYPRGNFILNLGCSDDSYNAIELVNVFDYNWSTKGFKVFLR